MISSGNVDVALDRPPRIERRRLEDIAVVRACSRACSGRDAVDQKRARVGCSRSAMTRSSVVLPQPDGPMRETKSPSRDLQVDVRRALGPRRRAVWKVSDTPRASTVNGPGAAAAWLAVGVCSWSVVACAQPGGSAVADADANATLCSVGLGRVATRGPSPNIGRPPCGIRAQSLLNAEQNIGHVEQDMRSGDQLCFYPCAS